MFVSQTQDELYNYYKTIAENTTLPIIMYNNKPKTNVTITPATVAKLADIENIVAVKDSTGDMTNAAEYILSLIHIFTRVEIISRKLDQCPRRLAAVSYTHLCV